MIDPFDYKEPSCALCGGKEFYYPDRTAPKGRIPVDRVIAKLDGFFEKNDLQGAEKHLSYWLTEAKELGDAMGELTLVSEQIGLYRKTEEEEKALAAVDRGLELVVLLGQEETTAGATIRLNAATTMKAFGRVKEALPHYEKAAEIYEKELKKDDPRRAGLYNNRALAYADPKRYDDAERDYLSALDVLKEVVGSENERAITYVNYAYLCDEAGNKSVFFPLRLMDEAFALLTSETVAKNGAHAAACQKCAPGFSRFGMQKEAEILNKRAEEIYART